MSEDDSNLDVFISYNYADEVIAKKIGSNLEKEKYNGRNIKVFLAQWDIKPGDNFIEKINEGLADAKFVVLVLSPEALQAEWPTAERDASLVSDPSGRMGRVIPIIVKPCRIPPLLLTRSWINLSGSAKFDTEMQRLLYKIKGQPLPRGDSTNTDLGTNSASEPDKVSESLHSNLFPVLKLPSVIWFATTTIRSNSEIYTQLGNKIPAFILKEGCLYTFTNLEVSSNKLRQVVNTHEIRSLNVQNWFKHSDKSGWLIHLLHVETRKFCRKRGLYFDNMGKQYYGDKKVITPKKITWIARVRRGQRGLIIPYEKFDSSVGKKIVYFYRHRAVKLRFKIIGDKLFLQIDPSWVFSKDGSILIQEQRSKLNTRLRSRIRNDVEFNEMRFWVWVLSTANKITIGSNNSTIEVSAKPLLFKTSYGVYGDHKPIPTTNYDPPPLVEESDDLVADEYKEDGDGDGASS